MDTRGVRLRPESIGRGARRTALRSAIAGGVVLVTLASVAVALSYRPPSRVRCASEHERCTFSGVRRVFYGAGDQWAVREFRDGVECSNAVFGDPAPNVSKSCWIEEVVGDGAPGPRGTRCASEHESCRVPGSGRVYYGAGEQWAVREFHQVAAVSCDNSVFGDPAPNVLKSCWVEAIGGSAPPDVRPAPPPPAVPPGGYFRMQSMLQERNNRCLESNRVAPGSTLGGASFMDVCQNVSGQLWRAVPDGRGYFRLKSQFRERENECLEGSRPSAPNDPLRGAARMDPCGNLSGQMWRLISRPNGYYQLTNAFLEREGRCLESSGPDAIDDPLGGAARMDPCGDFSGQLWRLIPAR